MKRHILILDLQFMQYGVIHAPKPSTAGLLIAGYHKTQDDYVTITGQIPNFPAYHTVYLVKDELDCYHDPAWLRYDNVVLVGRYWDQNLAYWNPEWEDCPPDMGPYAKWAAVYHRKHKFKKQSTMRIFSYKPWLIKRNGKIHLPTDDSVLIIDYQPELIDPELDALSSMLPKGIVFLHPFDITNNTEDILRLILYAPKLQFRRPVKLTMDTYIDDDHLQEIIELWNYYAPPIDIVIEISMTGVDDDSWNECIIHTLDFLEKWRFGTKKTPTILLNPVDIDTYSFPTILTSMKRWTWTNVGYSYNSALDYYIYDNIGNIYKIIEFLSDPEEYTSKIGSGVEPMKVLLELMDTYPHIVERMSKPIVKELVANDDK